MNLDLDKLEAPARKAMAPYPSAMERVIAKRDFQRSIEPATILALVERVRRLEAIRLLASRVVKECDDMGAVCEGEPEMDELRAALAALDKDKETTNG